MKGKKLVLVRQLIDDAPELQWHSAVLWYWGEMSTESMGHGTESQGVPRVALGKEETRRKERDLAEEPGYHR